MGAKVWRFVLLPLVLGLGGAARAGDGRLSEASERALEALRGRAPEAWRAVARAPETTEVAGALGELLSGRDHDLHREACRALIEIARLHSGVPVPIDPVLGCASHRSATCQESAARVIEAALASDPRWAAGREADATGALIPLTSSQRSRVLDAASASLRRITGESLGRDPLRWAEWYWRRHGRRIDFTGIPFELVAVIDARREPSTLDGQAIGERDDLARRLTAFDDVARKHNLEVRFVVIVGEEPSDGAFSPSARAVLAKVVARITAAGVLDADATLASPSERFSPPLAELFHPVNAEGRGGAPSRR